MRPSYDNTNIAIEGTKNHIWQYLITMKNESDELFTLQQRNWTTILWEQNKSVRGAGVVGQFPQLKSPDMPVFRVNSR